jgi:hypothetical protein
VQVIAEKVKIIERSVLSLRNELDRIQDDQRKNNVLVYGLTESSSGSYCSYSYYCYCKTMESLSSSLKISNIDYDDAFRLGKPKSGQIRPLIIKLIRYQDKHRIFAAANNLRGTQISISNEGGSTLCSGG